LEIEALDSLTPNSVVVWCTNGSKRTGVWGELLSTAARARGSLGAIIDGYIRDSRQVMEMGFPVFCAGLKPVDSSGRSIVIDYNCVVEVGDILVSPGDIVFADYDGVVVIPKDVEDEVIRLAMEKVEKDGASRGWRREAAYPTDGSAKYGVLRSDRPDRGPPLSPDSGLETILRSPCPTAHPAGAVGLSLCFVVW